MTSDPTAGQPVAKTAFGVARVRADESSRPDRLFDDPYAAAFAAAAPEAMPERPAPGTRGDEIRMALVANVVLRTRFFDEYLLDACAAGTRQVVLLAAGLDARAYRLDWADGVRVFELDLPEVLAFKEQVLREHGAEPRCDRIAVAVDLRNDWVAALQAAGFRASDRTAWLVEGLLVYLSAEEAAQLLTALTRCSATHSRLALEHGGAAAALSERLRKEAPNTTRDVTALWRGGLGEDAANWLTKTGWSVEVHDRDEVARGYGRDFPETPGRGFITAERR